MKFEVSSEKPYSQEFIAKIKESRTQFEQGEFTFVAKEDLENFLGLQ